MPQGSEYESVSVKSRIYSKEYFDIKAAFRSEFSGDIAGCTTVSLKHLTRDLSTRHISIRPTHDGTINMDLHGEVYEQVFGRNTGVGNEIIQLNRGGKYGVDWSGRELALEYGVPEQIVNDPYGFSLEFYNLTGAVKNLKSVAEAVPKVEKAIVRTHHKDNFLIGFGSLEKIAQFALDLKDRQGIQVVYGDRDGLAEFIMSQRHEARDDWAVGVYAGIPNKFIKAIIPLGKYEVAQIRKLI